MATKKQPCHCCAGTGVEEDDVLFGAVIRQLRLQKHINLRKLAQVLGISHSYLWQLEKGCRRWSPALVEKCQVVLALWEEKNHD
jgi:DNA-binding XRE family transcriptional regulator